MKANELRQKYLDFFKSKKHVILESASLVPEDDPTILFTPAGMSPLVRYLTGESHPLGKRLCSAQKCVRTDDIDEVGDLTHFTFFEMLGNWSLGDYFKKEAIAWSFEFLTDKKWLALDPKKIYISVFKGDKDAPKDNESIKIWQNIFSKARIKAKEDERIFTYPKKENWWGPAGRTGPCGPSSEMFYDTEKVHDKKFGQKCHPNCECGRFVEIWNDVFMQFNKKEDESFEPLKQKNIDTGLGFGRVVALTEWLDGKIHDPDPYLTDMFIDVIRLLEKDLTDIEYTDSKKEFRIICDHIRAAVFIIGDRVEPSNKDRGYILRRLIRRASFYGKHYLDINKPFLKKIANTFISIYGGYYKELLGKEKQILLTIEEEEERFLKTITKFISSVHKNKIISGRSVFHSLATYGVPVELSIEEAKKRNPELNEKKILKDFENEFEKHQEISRKSMRRKFSGGLQDHSDMVIRLHTATHLLHTALRQVLGKHVQQTGSNITAERLRFDFTHPDKLSKGQLLEVEKLVNYQISKNLKVSCETISLKKAKKQGVLAFFGQKYPDKVRVYSIGSFSKELCGGPHIDFTGALGKFIIKREQAVGFGKRRVYAVLK